MSHDHEHDAAAECPYCGPIEQLRAAEAKPETPEQTFARRWRNMRARGYEIEREGDADASAAHLRTLAADAREIEYAAPLEHYESPDPFAAALRALAATKDPR